MNFKYKNLFKNLFKNILKNILKNNNLFVFILLIIIIIYLLYLFFYNKNKLIENIIKTCANCSIKPDSGNCYNIYDISISIILQNSHIKNIDSSSELLNLSNENISEVKIEKIDMSYIFCEWETDISDCPPMERDNISKKGEEIDYNCCGNTEFYNTNNNKFKEYTIYKNINKKLDIILSNYDKEFGKSTKQNGSKYKLNYYISMDSKFLFTALRNEFNDYKDKKGIMFKVIQDGSQNILTKSLNNAQLINIQELQRYIAINYDINNNSYDQNEKDVIRIEIQDKLNTLLQKYYNSNRTVLSIGDIRSLQEIRRKIIEKNIKPKNELIEEKNYKYKMVDTNINELTYEPLDNNNYINCTGIKENELEILDAYDVDISNNYFGITDPSASYRSFSESDYNNNNTLTENKLKGELRRLQTISGGNTLVSPNVINQYLTAINSFYEKQIKNLMGPKTHNFDRTLEFDNNNLDIKNNTFFTYDNEKNNEYTCKPSLLTDPDFSYCGPDAYYTGIQF